MNIERPMTLTRDPQDDNDFLYEYKPYDLVPDGVDLRANTGFVENQLSVGSCTANAMVGAAEMFLIANGVFQDTEATDPLDLSRLFNYLTARRYLPQEFQDSDQGSIMRFNLKAANKLGICSEQLHPYNPWNWNGEPSAAAYADALTRKVGAYYRIPQIGPNLTFYPAAEAIRHALAKGYPVLIGMQVGAMIRTLTKDQDYPYVNPTSNPLIGGHEMLIVGYNATHFIIRNSWGKDWCDNGYFLCRQEVVVNDAMDIWVVQGFAGFETAGPDRVIAMNDPVTDMYRQALHREPDAAGLDYWKTKTLREAMCGICTSAEFFAVNLSVADLYRAILGREPDAGGLAYWTSTGLPLISVAAAFMASEEFAAKYGNAIAVRMPTSDFVFKAALRLGKSANDDHTGLIIAIVLGTCIAIAYNTGLI